MVTTKGWTFIGLNVVRFLSIISMILVFSSSILVLVNDIKAVNRFTSVAQQASSGSNSTTVNDMLNCDYIEGSTVPNQPAGAFWAVLNRLLIITQVFLLTLSEIGWPMRFFESYFPVLGRSFGVGALGVIQCLLGAAVLSHHVDDFALVSAFLVFSVGCLNIVVGLIFREGVKHKRSMKFWGERFEGLELPTTSANRTPPFPVKTLHTGSTALSHASQPPSHSLSHSNTLYSQHSRSYSHDADAKQMNSMSVKEKQEAMFGWGYGFGRQGEKVAESRGMILTRPLESVPPYAPRPREGKAPSRSGSPPPRRSDDDDDEA